MECQYCKNVFSTKTNLNNHQRRARYCLKLRGETVEKQYKCKFCDKSFNRNDHLIRHQQTCNSTTKVSELEEKISEITRHNSELEFKFSEKEKENKELKVHIKELEKQIQEIALKAVSRPTTTNKTQINTYIQNMEPVTTEHLIDNAQHLTIEHIKKGVEGYAEYALEYPLKDRVLCSDYARRKVKFKDKDGNVITDPEMTTLAKKFFKSIHEKNKELICESANELKERLGDENVMDTVVKLFDYKEAVNRASDGEKTDFHHDFVRQVCSQTIKE
jgi:hypothetical protein